MIRRLPPELIREIAAGEVVRAPVDVLKELLENALDAGANRLEVELVQGGIEKLVVSDNGQGIPVAELPLAAEQHSTSKLETLDEIQTFGFRGEGLYALRHAATLRVTSRPAAQLGGATLLAAGDHISLTEHPSASGTSVEVSELFARLPARKSALEPASEELRKCTQLLGRYLIHHPHLAIRLKSDGLERWNFAGGSFQEAAKFIWGPVTANRLLSIHVARDGFCLQGLISRPELSRPRRDRLLLAVNGRPVEWEERWLKQVLSAYQDLLPLGHYPLGVLNLKLAARSILVNTSPDKSHVRFLAEPKILDFMQNALSASLQMHPLATPLPMPQPVEGIVPAPRHAFPKLHFIGHYRDLYLLAEADDTLWVVDQHAAHERILFEELCRRYTLEPPIELRSAELIQLSQEETANFLANQDDLQTLGIVLEPFGSGTWRVRSIPAFLSAHPQLVASIIKSSLSRSSLHDAWRSVLGRLACLPAIKAGHKLANASAQTLLDELQHCETPWACPHGRPTTLVLSELELARRFGRRNIRATERAGARG